jgi:hypothetical protein
MGWHPSPLPTDSSGRQLQVCFQEADQSCFPSSVAMSKYYVTGRRPPEALGRFAVQIGGNSGASLAMRNWDLSLTLWAEMERGINEAMLNFTAHTAGRYFLSGRCAINRPAICTVIWNGGGGHAVVCLGQVPGGNTVLILDPWFGRQEVPAATLPAYNPVGTPFSRDPGGTNAGTFYDQPRNYLIIGTRGR